MAKAHVTIRMDAGVLAKVDTLAKARGFSRSMMIERLLAGDERGIEPVARRSPFEPEVQEAELDYEDAQVDFKDLPAVEQNRRKLEALVKRLPNTGFGVK